MSFLKVGPSAKMFGNHCYNVKFSSSSGTTGPLQQCPPTRSQLNEMGMGDLALVTRSPLLLSSLLLSPPLMGTCKWLLACGLAWEVTPFRESVSPKGLPYHNLPPLPQVSLTVVASFFLFRSHPSTSKSR